MQSSKLKIPFLLQAERLTASGASWTSLGAVWGGIERTGESGRYNRIEKATHDIIIRRRTDIAIESGMRMVDGVKAYFILAVRDDDPERRWMRLVTQDLGLMDGGAGYGI